MSLESALLKSVLGTVVIIAASTIICKAADTYMAVKGVTPTPPAAGPKRDERS